MYRLILLILLLFTTVGIAGATEQFARQTGKPCVFCHLDPAGGGELTAAGRAFLAQRGKSGAPSGPSTSSRMFHLIVGYVHLLTAIFWFGTILYVHLVLKPSYASAGLPRGEVRLGLVSMAVMAVTGAILTVYRIDSLHTLLHTRFGVLLLVKIGLFLMMVASALIAVLFVGPHLKRGGGLPAEGGDLTLEQLGRCDGQEGRPNYFAYRGRVFNASESKLWQGGHHMRRHPAGCDLTEALAQAPHGEDRILKLPEVGKLLPAKKAQKTGPQRLFYVIAYLNLGLVLAIVFVVALWRWG